ncbi:MAG: hypothetical protein ACLFUS_03015 [Candidatus Sumerlaeia bacterium]
MMKEKAEAGIGNFVGKFFAGKMPAVLFCEPRKARTTIRNSRLKEQGRTGLEFSYIRDIRAIRG